MRPLRVLYARILGIFSRSRRERELEMELEAHFELHVAENIRSGLTPDEARREAALKFGGLEAMKEDWRDAHRLTSVESVWHDLRHAARMLRKTPAFAAGVIATIALAAGATTAILSVYEGLILRALPVPDPGELRVVLVSDAPDAAFSEPLYERMKAALPAGAQLAALIRPRRGQVAIEIARPEGANYQLVSPNYFDTLQLRPHSGRFFRADDSAAAVISHAFALTRWPDQPERAVGKTIRLNGYALHVIGVATAGFTGTHPGDPAHVWVPLAAQHELRYNEDAASFGSANTNRPWRTQMAISWLRLLLRPAPGNDLATITASLDTLHRQAQSEVHGSDPDPAERRKYSSRSVSLISGVRGFDSLRSRFLTPLTALVFMSSAVLLIACFNVATLLLSRAEARHREIGVRLAIGASRTRIVQQLLTESALLAALGCATGALVGLWIAPETMRLLAGGIPAPIEANRFLLGLTMALCAITTLLCGVIPAFRSSRVGLLPALKSTAGIISGGRLRANRFVVTAQVAFATVLLVTAGLFTRTLWNLSNVSPGYAASSLLSVRIDPSLGGYQQSDYLPLYRRLQDRIRELPGVQAVSMSLCPLATGSGCGTYSRTYAEGFVPRKGESLQVQELSVMPNYLDVLGLELVRGRTFIERETRPVVIVNQTLARYYFGTEDAVGRRIGYSFTDATQFEIVGVMRDVPVNNLREEVPRLMLYPVGNEPVHLRNIDIRTAGDPAVVAQSVRQLLAQTEPNLPITGLRTLTQQIALTFSAERSLAWLSSAFGLIAVLLASVGVYSLVSYSVTRRTGEIGLRIALGASPGDVRRNFLWQAAGLSGIGVAAGLALAFLTGRALRHLLFGIASADPATYATAGVLFLLVALGASFAPIRRASRVDPVVALRAE